MTSERAHIILIVEDEFVIRITLADFLSGCGFEVHEAANADEALVALARTDIEIEFVFTDVRMPGLTDGFGLAKWVRENRPGLPVLITSGDVGQANVGREHYASERFLPKPYEFDAVEGHIRESITQRKRA